MGEEEEEERMTDVFFGWVGGWVGGWERKGKEKEE